MKVLKLAMSLVVTTTLLGCQVTIKPSVDTYTPAHSYYERHPNLHRYDKELGLYIFLESANTYYLNSFYYHWSVKHNRWERAKEPHGNWHQIHERKVPPKLLNSRIKIKIRPIHQREKGPKRVNNGRDSNRSIKQGSPVNRRAASNNRATPAPRAAAYGYYKRNPNKHRYDSRLDLYIFLERPNTYYSNHYYYRWSAKFKRWERAQEPYGNWHKVRERKVPSRLVKEQIKINKRLVNQRGQRTDEASNRRGLISNMQQRRSVNKRANGSSQISRNRDRLVNQRDNHTTRGSSKKDYIDECEENGKSRDEHANSCRD
ncbi:MAG: hypothetical protein GQ470_03165 [Gammaproteobacteria bacterium]|nr:hypothetical protein [Gammaproteobacteria bacterium]